MNDSKKISSWILLVSFFLITCALSGCSSAKKKEAVAKTQAAIDSLKKIGSATDVGMNYLKYGELLIEAKAKVDEAMPVIKDADIQSKIKSVMQKYLDVNTIWREKIENSNAIWFSKNYEAVKVCIDKYSLPVNSSDEDAISLIWAKASAELTDLKLK